MTSVSVPLATFDALEIEVQPDRVTQLANFTQVLGRPIFR